MHDTPRKVEMQMIRLYAGRTPEERLTMAFQMFDAGIELMKAGILAQHPEITEAQLQATIFHRLYDDCFSSEETERIIAYLTHKS